MTKSEIVQFLTTVVLIGKLKKPLIFSHFAKEFLEMEVFDFMLIIL